MLLFFTNSTVQRSTRHAENRLKLFLVEQASFNGHWYCCCSECSPHSDSNSLACAGSLLAASTITGNEEWFGIWRSSMALPSLSVLSCSFPTPRSRYAHLQRAASSNGVS